MTPEQLILERFQAFSRSDFGFIFDSYHSASNFRRQFPERAEYIEFGRISLSADFQILDCRILGERCSGPEAEVISLVTIEVEGKVQRYAEMTWLQFERDAWKYHRGLKITHDELPASPEELTFADFAKLDHATVY